MKNISIAIIGGGASGLFLANHLNKNENVVIFERSERLGRKLSATGNGQGNITNLAAERTPYFAVEKDSAGYAQEIISSYTHEDLTEFFKNLGVLLSADERGRVYPTSRQASALTDALRFALGKKGIEVRVSTKITDIVKTEQGFVLCAEVGEEKKKESFLAEKVVICAGGKAAKNFGTDGTAYALAQKFGHTVTPLYPSLVQLKTDTTQSKTLKGIRVTDGRLTAFLDSGEEYSLTGDIIFTEYGVSGDAVFRLSAYIADKITVGVTLAVDFLPTLTKELIYTTLLNKRKVFPTLPTQELLFGIVNNQIGRAVMKRANGDIEQAAALIKCYPIRVTGSLGFDYAQVTKGGIPLRELDKNLQSRLVKGLYFAGEIVDVDGPCGGYNLQWAYSSACQVAKALNA